MSKFNFDFLERDFFSSDTDYQDYLEGAEEYGLPFHLRCEDLGCYSINAYEEEFAGQWDTFEEFAEQLFFDIYDLPEELNYYVDIDKFARDLSYDYSVYDGVGGIYIFHD